jgi:tetratricopeptide (TPR) repeat protein
VPVVLPPSTPPAPVLATAGRATAEAMVLELQARGLAVAAPLLVLTLSDVWTWTRTGECAARRPHPLAALTDLPPLRDALAGLEVGLRARGEPAGTLAELAQDCADVADWLEGRGALQGAIGYAEAAAALEPESSGRAHSVARLARAAGLFHAARAWGAWSLRLAGRGRDHATRAAALVELGHLAAARQQYAEARRLFSVARRLAVSRRLTHAEGDALCGLAPLQCHHGDGEALELFARAVEAYEPGSGAVLDLGHILLTLWVNQREYHRAALLGRVLLAVSCSVGDALVLSALLARAAAALGWELTYESACHRAVTCLGKLPPDTPCAASLLDLARAHGALGFWPRVELAADFARVYARRTGDAAAARLAGRMLRAAKRPTLPRRIEAELFPDRTLCEVPEGRNYPAGHPVRLLVRCFRQALVQPAHG